MTTGSGSFPDRDGQTRGSEAPRRRQEEEAEGHGVETHPRQVRDHQQEAEQRISVGGGFGSGLRGCSNGRPVCADMVSQALQCPVKSPLS